MLGDEPVGPLLRGRRRAPRRVRSTFSPCSSVPVRNQTSSPRWRCQRVRTSAGDRRVGVADVRGVVDVVDRRRDVERLAGRAHGAILVAPRIQPAGRDEALGTRHDGPMPARGLLAGPDPRPASARWSSPALPWAIRATPHPAWPGCWLRPTSSPPRTPAGCGGCSRDLGVRRAGPVVSFYDDVERARLPAAARTSSTTGGTVALVTDAGMPSVSDPGYRAARAALAAGHRVTSLPGPSAVTTALAVSGLPCDRFCFEGFLPRQAGRAARPAGGARRRAAHAGVLRSPRTGWPTPWPTWSRRSATNDRRRCAGSCPRPTRRSGAGSLAELAAWAADGVRGEITLVVSGAPPAVGACGPGHRDPRRPGGRTDRGRASTARRRSRLVARSSGVPRRTVYDAVSASGADLIQSLPLPGCHATGHQMAAAMTAADPGRQPHPQVPVLVGDRLPGPDGHEEPGRADHASSTTAPAAMSPHRRRPRCCIRTARAGWPARSPASRRGRGP